MSGALPKDAIPGVTHPALFAALALPVLGATALNGFWLGKGILLALAALVLNPSWRDALGLLASIAGIQGVLAVFRAWRSLQAPGAAPASSDRKTLVAVAALAAVAAVVLLSNSGTVGAPPLQVDSDADGMVDAAWFPGFRLGLLAVGAALLSLVPGPSRAATDQLWMRQLRGRARDVSQMAGDSGRATVTTAIDVSTGLAAVVRGARTALSLSIEFAGVVAKRVARWIDGAVHGFGATLVPLVWPSDDESSDAEGAAPATAMAARRRLGAFLLMAAPILYAVATLGALLLEYGITLLIWIVGFVLLPLMLLAAAGLAALLRLWWALLADHGAPAWARVSTMLALPLAVATAWALRDATDHHLLAMNIVIAGVSITPPIVAVVDGVVLLLLHALPRWPLGVERAARVLALLALVAVVGARFAA